LQTNTVTQISTSGATFSATIISLNNEPLLNHGFVWSSSDVVFLHSDDFVTLGERSQTGDYQTTIQATFIKGRTYFVKAYVSTETYTVYGNLMSFKIP
jgi:hypothetical protein